MCASAHTLMPPITCWSERPRRPTCRRSGPAAGGDAGAGLALVRDGGAFVGVQPSAKPATERGITVDVVVTHPDGARLGDLLARTASGELPARVHAVVPLDQVAGAHRAVAKGGVRGRYVLEP
jgi:Zinc-binding dehydrogenase